jgi:hypothetical protein
MVVYVVLVKSVDGWMDGWMATTAGSFPLSFVSQERITGYDFNTFSAHPVPNI